MITLHIQELVFVKQAAWRRKITLVEIAESTGISRMTLHRMIKDKSYKASLEHLEKLCTFFQCEIQELVKFVPESPNFSSIKSA